MKTEIKIENCQETFCTIHAKEATAQIEQAAQKIRMMSVDGSMAAISAWDGDYSIPLKLNQIYRIFSMEKKVYVETEKENLLLKLRLYEFEDQAQKYGWDSFIRISNTDIVNFDNVVKLDMSLTGTIKVIFTNGNSAFVSRRYINRIKEKLCLRKQ